MNHEKNHALAMLSRRSLWILPAWAMLGAGCGQSPEAKAARDEISQATDATKRYAEELASDARVEAEERLKTLRADLAKLRERIAEETSEKDWEALADGIEAKLDAAGKELAELGKEGADAAEETWDELRAKLAGLGEELQESWREIRQ